jgi:hypothetical protein
MNVPKNVCAPIYEEIRWLEMYQHCQDYARMYVGGHMGCTKPTTLGYWDKIKEKQCNEKS